MGGGGGAQWGRSTKVEQEILGYQKIHVTGTNSFLLPLHMLTRLLTSKGCSSLEIWNYFSLCEGFEYFNTC